MTEQLASQHTSEMLQEMIQSTHHLDEILQRLCEADTLRNEQTTANDNASESSEERDATFTDCMENITSQDLDETSHSYFAKVKKVLQAGGGTVRIAKSVVDNQRFSEGTVGDLALRFAACTRDTSFVFHSLQSPPCDEDLGAASPSESNVSYSNFISQLRQQIIACDHIVPVERADEATQLAIGLLEEQQRRLLGAISTHFPYQRDSVYWVQNHRVCEVFVQETKQKNQWGLQIKLNVASRLQARVDGASGSQNDDEVVVESDPGLSSCTHCRVFLPKTCYSSCLTKDATFQTSIAVELALYVPEKENAKAEESIQRARGSYENQRSGREVANANVLQQTEMPEIVTVSRWGSHDANPVLDNQSTAQSVTKSRTFQRMDIKTPFPRNRIVQAACSRFHTLFLNDTGLVFAYGHTIDGALGLGNDLAGYVAQPTLVNYFFDNLIIIQDISCGGDQLVGAHSAAVCQAGGLYTWGVGIALGRGTLRSASIPQRIDLPSIETKEVTDVTDFATPVGMTASSVSCGSGFCVALTRDGYAFSWGKWSNGRLGLGRIPIIARTSRRHGGGAVRKQFQSFQLTPRLIQIIHTAQGSSGICQTPLFSKVACGDSHCLGLSKTGALVTWGRGNSGQQGRGDVSDALVPTLVFKNCSQKQWRDVAAGENWSMALSIDGQIWSWGAYGSAVLGHGLLNSTKNALLAETILQRHQRLLSQRRQSTRTSLSCPRLPQLKWMTPQMIPCFTAPDIRIRRISAGAQHAAAISVNGDLYMWGEDYSDNDDPTDFVLSSLPKLVNSGQQVTEGETNARSAMDIGTLSVEHVVCGGHQTIALTSKSFLARSMSKLYRTVVAQEKHIDYTNITGADLNLVVSGQHLPAHKLLLAQRSPILRELILDEEQQQQNRLTASNSEAIMELLIPTLRVDVARLLLEYIYTDDFTIEASKKSYYLLHDVLRASKLYKLPSLALLCRKRILSVSPSYTAAFPPDQSAESDTNSEDERDSANLSNAGVTRTLNDDMKFALSDAIWADTLLIAEGRSIPVHRCMLIARSEYFRAVLEFRRSTAQITQTMPKQKKMAVVHVEDSYSGIVRVLRFIYFDQVALPQIKRRGAIAEGNLYTFQSESDSEANVSDHLLEDLVAADKYGLERMKRLCEHAVCVNAANCLEILELAELIHAAHLKQVAMRFVQTNLAIVTGRQEEFQRFQNRFPRLLEELYASLRDASSDEVLLRKWHAEVGTSLAAPREEREVPWGQKLNTAKFPWVPLCFAVAFGTLYLSVMHAQEHEYSYVPATNLVAIAAIGGAIVMGYL